MITRWTLEAIEDFRQWHEKRIMELYWDDEEILKQFRLDREKFLRGVRPK